MLASGTESLFLKKKTKREKKKRKKKKLIYTKSPIKPGWVEGTVECLLGT